MTAEQDVRVVLIETFAANDSMNQHLLERLDPRAWRAKPAGPPGGRTIAAIFAHMHNCRLVWIRRSAPHLRCPAPLDPFRCTVKQTAVAHRRSSAACLRMLKEALSEGADRRVTKYSRGSWTHDWPAGATMFAFMFSHDAHHRGQIIAQAHQLGFRLPLAQAGGIWNWDRMWKDAGMATRPR